jgi:ABC-type hemin transport system ATPase subunit
VPGRSLNDTERRLLDRWNAGFGPSLRSIEIMGDSSLRGLAGMTIDFRYPLVVIAGKNGTGKSTLLACAACAYHNTGPYELWILGGKYFRFTDFFFATPQESPLLHVQVRWTYRLDDRTVDIRTVTKGPSRWRGYPSRPNRAVEFVGLLRALHPSELRVLRRHFGADRAAQPVSLDVTHQATVSHVMTRSYAAVRLGTSGRYSLHFLDADGTCYSGFNMGSGEDVACQLARIVHRLPQGGLLIIEEIEVGLHPAAQRNLMRQLLDLCWEKRLQVICSSHSQAVLECVPADARVLMVRHGSTLQPRYAVSVGEAMSDMAMLPVSELAVYVEDELARNLLMRALPASIRQRVRVTTCGAWEDVVRFLATFRRDPTLGPVAALLDGDRQGHDSEHIDTFRRYLGGNITDNDRNWLTDRVHYLPGDAPPESYLRALGTEPTFREILAADLNADPVIVEEFFRGPLLGNNHSLAYNLGLRVGLDHGQTEAALVGAAIRSRPADFQPIIAFLQQRLALEI